MNSKVANLSSERHENPVARSFQVLDCTRLLAVLSIVWLHTPESTALAKSVDIGRFAVPFFTFVALFLAFQSALRHPQKMLVEYSRSRFIRIYLVFVFWSAVYALIRIIGDFILRFPLPRVSLLDLLWDGTAHHIWFLPFIFVASIVSFAVAKATRTLGQSYWIIVSACIISGLALALSHAPNTFRNWGFTFELSADVLPSVLLAVAFAMIYARTTPEFFSQKRVTALGVLLWLGSLALLLTLGRTIFLETISGFGLMIASLSCHQSALISRVARWGKFSFAIYILHVLFLEGFQNVTQKMGWPHSPLHDATTFMVTLLCCGIAIFLLNRNCHTRQLLLS